MNSVVLYTLGSVFIVSLISLIGITTLSLNTRLLNKSIFILISIAVGALFTDALINLIPETYDKFKSTPVATFWIMSGIFSFFILEKILNWRHTHNIENIYEAQLENKNVKTSQKIHPLGFLILFSDGIHNFLDGIIIGASYLISIEVGMATTVAIILHEIPQEISDFGILLHSGMKKMQALLLNFLSALTAVLGAVLALAVGNTNEALVPIATAFAAGSFLYIAGSDLVPELHKVTNIKNSIIQFAAMVIGAAGIWILFLI